ncbi:hypothetical protein JOC54_004606 [Alkalihalobacillus xiaoxiensis]|uniref:Uncharacterized protein n=1 Tax=Shouchella xiaoxiensis TaxID=766895 RepID=A0ABS2T0J0_9BACI|nr:hypothetical protein [Shouchella xiaoxiensis]MBM7841303.1 hypothetical protein [Shouchella xiaoxiensis]
MSTYILKHKEDFSDLKLSHVRGLSTLLHYNTNLFSAETVLIVLPSFFNVESEASLFYEDIQKNKPSITTLLYLPESLLDYHQHITVLSFLRLFDIVSLTKPILFELTNETILAHALKKLGDTTVLSIVVIEDQQKMVYTDQTCPSIPIEDLSSLLSTPSFLCSNK